MWPSDKDLGIVFLYAGKVQYISLHSLVTPLISEDWLLDLNMNTSIGKIQLENFIKEYLLEKWNHMYSPKFINVEVRLILKLLI